MKRVEKLSDAIVGERVGQIAPLAVLPTKRCFVSEDGGEFLDDLFFFELANSDSEEEWFDDKRVGKWSDFRNSLTNKNLSALV